MTRATALVSAIRRFRNPPAKSRALGGNRAAFSIRPPLSPPGLAGCTSQPDKKRFLPVIQSSDCHKVASGNRNNTTGALNVVGTYGYSWSSSPAAASSTNASNLRFLASEMTPLNSNNRANGFPVRCVQHLREAASIRFCESGFSGCDKKQFLRPGVARATVPASEARRFRNPLTVRIPVP